VRVQPWPALTAVAFGCKRIIRDPGYLDCLNQDNVKLVTSPIERITENGILTAGGEVQLDVLILATGFDVSARGFGAGWARALAADAARHQRHRQQRQDPNQAVGGAGQLLRRRPV
jgi:cation diffusion facilitator CzcD-associated flavoprotein CzcO